MSDNRDIYQILNDLYKAYLDKDCNKFYNFLKEAESIDKNNAYIIKYKKLYKNICGGSDTEKEEKSITGKVIKYMGKTIKCPHCGAPLIEDSYNRKVIKDYKAGIIKELKFKCVYCGTEFIWDNKGIKPLFLEDIIIGGYYEIDGIKYKVSGVVQYTGIWKEDGDKGDLIYNEYILYDKNGDIYRLSESKSKWLEGEYYNIENEVEITKKVDFTYKIDDITDDYIKIDGEIIYFSEKDEVTVKKIYGEVGKGYKIGEKVTLYGFRFNGRNYILEKEQTSSNREINIYEVVYYSNYNNPLVDNKSYPFNTGSIFKRMIFYAFLSVFFFMAGFGLFYKRFIFKENIITLNINKDFNKTNINKLDTIGKGIYEIYFSGTKPFIYKYIRKYDAGGKEYKFIYYNGVYFKLENDKDKQDLINFFNNLEKEKNVVLLIDSENNVKLNLSKYSGDIVLRRMEYKSILGF